MQRQNKSDFISHNCYKKAWPQQIVLTGIKELSGVGFVPQSAVALQGVEEAEQEQDEEVSEDMLAFAFGMDE